MARRVHSPPNITAQKTSKFLSPTGRIHDRICGCKCSLLKVREQKYRGSMAGAGGICRQRESALLQVLLKLVLTYGKGGAR
jgi:hypothetical protein